MESNIIEATADPSHSGHFDLPITDVTNNMNTGCVEFMWRSSRALLRCPLTHWRSFFRDPKMKWSHR